MYRRHKNFFQNFPTSLPEQMQFVDNVNEFVNKLSFLIATEENPKHVWRYVGCHPCLVDNSRVKTFNNRAKKFAKQQKALDKAKSKPILSNKGMRVPSKSATELIPKNAWHRYKQPLLIH